MSEPFTDFVEHGETGTSLEQFGAALTTYVHMADRPVTVEEAAVTFSTLPMYVRAAAAEATWLFVEFDRAGQEMLVLEGE